MSRWWVIWGIVGSCVLGGCATSPPQLHHPSTAEWQAARRELRRLAETSTGATPRTTRIALTIKEPYTGQEFRSRGAVAVHPGDQAMRMIMLGPGGTTALDLWVRGEDFRFEIPALELLERGDADTPPKAMRGLPVRFLAWWLLRPYGGQLLWTSRDPSSGEQRYLLRDGLALVDVRVHARGDVDAVRTTWSGRGAEREIVDRERVKTSGSSCGEVRYEQESTGLVVSVQCEGVERDAEPDPRAFTDPDELARADVGGE